MKISSSSLRLLLVISLLNMAFYTQAGETDRTALPVEVMSSGNVLQMFFGLSVVVLLIFFVAWFMRRMGQFQGNTSNQLKVIGGLSVGQRERVLLLQVGDKQLLVGAAPGSVRTLHVFDEPVISPQDSADKVSFSQRLAMALNKKESVE